MVTASEEMYFVTAVRLVRDVNFMTETRKKIDAAIMIAAADAHTHALEKAIVEIATRKPVAASMQLTARQFFHTLHDAMRRLSKAGDDKERFAIAATFAELRNEQPDYPPLLRAQCELAQSLQDLPLAADCLATLLEKFPDDIDARLQLATFLVDQGAAADALRVLDDASMLPGTNVQALKLRVRAHGHLRRWEVARQYSELVVEYAPADVQALFWHGMVLSHTGEIDAALETLNRTLILAPDHAEAAYHAGVLLAELGNHADAEKVFRRALKIVPTPATHFRLLHCMKSRQQPSDWLAEARRFVSAYPDIEFSRLIESRIARRQGELAREAEILLPLAEQAAALDDDALVCELVGELLSILPYHDVSPRLLQRLHSRYNAAARVIHPQLVALRAPSELASGKLKIGYLVDFSLPLVEDLIVSLAVHANRTRLVMTVYAVSPLNSVPQLRLDSVGVGVVILAGLDEHRSAWKIRADHVDILVDASSFGLYAKPGLRSYRPAPIQIGLPGFGQPAGIGDFDFLISDRTMTLAMEADSILPAPLFVETCALPVLPGIPDATQFTRAFLGIGDNTAIFGVLAPVEMISSRCVGLWKILAERLPDAAFLVSPLDSDDVAPIRNILIAAGIDSARILSITTPHSSTFVPALSGIVDVVLDTIPGGDYFSVRTSLILGIPIVTMPGRMPEERVGLTILSHLGMASPLAASGRDYVDTASRLAVDPDERAVQSKRIRASWMDASLPGMPFSMQEFTRCFETAIFGAWERHSQSCLETKT
ncbi:MAG: tetratricopeptide repeat protein [Betaproteobacteria bacterium]|nr:tetratricopeptide repeat protein [Betaproteobacteria bacterium]